MNKLQGTSYGKRSVNANSKNVWCPCAIISPSSTEACSMSTVNVTGFWKISLDVTVDNSNIYEYNEE